MTRSARPRRIALVANYPWKLTEVSTPYSLYVSGFLKIGVDVITVCRHGCQLGYPFPTVIISGDQDLCDAEFWAKLGCDCAVLWSWLQNNELIRSIEACGVRVLAIGDSDGLASPRYHPLNSLRMRFPHDAPSSRSLIGALKSQVRAWALGASAAHRSVAESVRAPSVHTLAGTGAVAALDRVLVRSGHEDAAGLVRWLPYPVSDDICSRPVVNDREVRVVAVGRWTAWQKNSALMHSTIERVCRSGSGIKFSLIGLGSPELFASLVARYPGEVSTHGQMPRARIGELMASSRCVLISSRWESGPQVAYEMLASGGTVVGTPIPTLKGIVDGNQFGRVSKRHTPRSLEGALLEELSCWDAGERIPGTISSYWRSHVSSESVARKIGELLGVPDVQLSRR